MELFIIFVLYAAVMITDFVPVIRQKKKKDICIYAITLLCSLSILVLTSSGINVPGPSGLIVLAVEKIFMQKG